MDYRSHCSFDGCPREVVWKWKESRGNSWEALREHDPGLYAIIVTLSIVCWSSNFPKHLFMYTEISQKDIHVHISMCRSTS